MMEHIEQSADSICEYLLNCNFNETTYSFLMSLADCGEAPIPNRVQAKEVLRQLKNSSLDSEDKWKILEAAYDYPTHIKELLSIVMPAAKLIESRQDLYSAANERFIKLFSDDTPEISALSDSVKKFGLADAAIVVPSLFCFETTIKIFPNKLTSSFKKCRNKKPQDTPVPTVIFILAGIAQHLMAPSHEIEIAELCRKFQTLSDSIRLEILFYLCSHKEYGRMLCKKFGLQHSILSYHITKLLDAGFITAEVSGTQTFYTAVKENIVGIFDILLSKTE